MLVDGALCHRGFGPMTAVAKELAAAFSVYTYDCRGRGESSNTPPFAPAREIEDLEAVIREAGGSAGVCGVSSGAALALDAAARGVPIERLALDEPPFIVDDTRPPITGADARQMQHYVDGREHGAAVAHFLRMVGVPRMGIMMMRLMPMWGKLKAVAPTLPNDLGLHRAAAGRPAAVADRMGVGDGADGGHRRREEPRLDRNSNAALAAVIPGAGTRCCRRDAHGEGQGAGAVSRASSGRRDARPARTRSAAGLGVRGVHRLRFRRSPLPEVDRQPTITPTDRNSLCQFCSDSNQKRLDVA